ncbi:oligomeric Golgi complex subunit 6 [Globomyces pollinis-pini]|nr:oligomeric Golgi complex subunit 6 [Globomyces pollinis-pini]
MSETIVTKLSKGNPLSRKLDSIFNSSLDDVETQKALKSLSVIYPDYKDLHSFQLRNDIDERLSNVHNLFLQSMKVVQDEMLLMGNAIEGLSDECRQMEMTLDKAYQDTSEILKVTSDLKQQSDDCDVKKVIAAAFIQKFTLPSNDIKLLTSSSEPITMSFFEALERLQQIHQDCKVLLIADQQNAGLNIMDSMNSYQEIAYERLFKWTQGECRMMKSESPEVSLELKKAMHAFRLRPILFDACIEEISSIRQSALPKYFQNAISVGGPNGFPKPIEFHAHDSQRYAGDLFAWVHQACVGEREMLENVFGIASNADKKRTAVQVPDAFQDVDGYKATEEALLVILDKNTQGLATILSDRLSSMFGATLGCLSAYKIANMIQFYEQTIYSLLGPEATLLKEMQKLSKDSLEAFQVSLNIHASDLIRNIPTISSSLEPPQIIRDSMLQLKEVLVSYDMSMISATKDIQRQIDLIFESFLTPTFEVCNAICADLPVLESAIFRVNCYHMIQTLLTAFSFTDVQVRNLETMIEEQISELVNEQVVTMLKQSGLYPLIRSMEQNQRPFGLQANTDSNAINQSMNQFDKYLLDVTMDVSETLYRIQSLDIGKRVASKGCRMFFDKYKFLVNEILNPENKYEFPATLIRRSVEEVETLLSMSD